MNRWSGKRHRDERRWPLLWATLWLHVAAFPAVAADPVGFSIEAQSADKALIEFARQASVSVLFPTVQINRITAHAVRGNYRIEEALAILLKDTGLAAGVTTVGSISITITRENGDSSVTTSKRSGWLHALISSAASLLTAHAEETAGPAASAANAPTLEEIVVTAQKREEHLQNVPISISVLSGPQLESPTITSASDALSTIPGVAVNQAYLSGGTVVTIRGVSAPAVLYAGSSPVAYYIDGIPFGLVKSSIAPDQDVYDLQRIEVLRGPQGTLYGASALNGVVRVLTNDADLSQFDFKTRGSDSYTEGGGNNYRGDASINAPIVAGKLALRAVVGYENDSGYIDSPLGSNFNDSQRRNYRFKLNAQPTDGFSVGLSYWGARDDYGMPSNGNDAYRNVEVNRQPITTGFDASSLRLAFDGSGYSIANTASYLRYKNDSLFDFGTLVGFPLTIGTVLRSDVLSDELLVTSRNSGPWRWNVGAMYRKATENRGNVNTYFGGLSGPASTQDLQQDTASRSYAVYGELTRAFLDERLELTGGLRWFEDRQDQNGTQTAMGADPTMLVPGPNVQSAGVFVKTTPRAVVTWHQNADWTIYGSFAEGFRSGVLNDINTPIGPAKADTLYNYELGTKGSLWNGLVSFETAVYYINWKDVQQSLDVPLYVNGAVGSYTGAVVNGDSASGPGIDFSLLTRPLASLTLGIAGNWNKLQLDKPVYSSGVVFFPQGSRLNSSPETTLSGSGAYAFPVGTTGFTGRLSAAVTYTSAQLYRVNPGGPTVLLGGGDALVVGRVGLALESPNHWSATLFVNNINNERGAVVRPFLNPDLTARIRPLTGGLQLDYHFR